MDEIELIIQKIKRHNERNGGWAQVYQYINDTYSWLQKIPIGKIFTINIMYPDFDDADLFTQILKLYIYEIDPNTRFLLDDFKQFRRN